ncbi:hypothetical protein A2369_02050 [candidate division WS6 bacterium RIFOXYB1_FULL_33_15]|nr:MAG: hypothetical protein A2369_02050 [candidate division WS6 bacterium RIFOXYB1_FULL_33_15]
MKYQIFKTKCSITEKVFLSILGILLLILTFKFFFLSNFTLQNLLFYIVIVAIFLALTFLAYFDFKKMEVHSTLSLALMLLLFASNLSLFLVLGSEEGIKINNWVYIPYQNFLSTLILGSLFQLTVLLSKEKALGQGDVRIAIIVGLLIGYNNIIYWSYITVFSALFYGLIIAYKKKKFKGLKIPFVPFMVLGTMIVILINI